MTVRPFDALEVAQEGRVAFVVAQTAPSTGSARWEVEIASRRNPSMNAFLSRRCPTLLWHHQGSGCCTSFPAASFASTCTTCTKHRKEGPHRRSPRRGGCRVRAELAADAVENSSKIPSLTSCDKIRFWMSGYGASGSEGLRSGISAEGWGALRNFANPS